MEPLVEASFAGRESDGGVFLLDADWRCRIFVLADDLVRVLFTRSDRLKEQRSWTIAPGGVDVPWEGRERLDVRMFPRPSFDLRQSADGITFAARELTVKVRLRPFGLEWSAPGSAAFAQDRPTQAYQWSERSGAMRHYMVRARTDQYFGLGDKTGTLDKHGRRLRTLAMDALGYDAQRSDPLYKHWPFLLARDPRSAMSFGLYYDTLSATTFDLGCEHDNYHGFYRYVEIDDGDLDYFLFPGPRIRDVVRKFTELTGRMAFGPRWSLGYANTAMSLADAPDAQAQLAEFADRLIEHDVPMSAFHFGSGYTSIGRRRYVFTWNRDKFPDPHAAVDRFRRRNIRTVVNLKPCLLDDHPGYAEVARKGAFVTNAHTGTPCIGQFWDGHGAHVDFTNPAGVAWWQGELARQVLDYGVDAGWNDNNEYEIWDDFGASHGFGEAIPIERSRPLQALLMTRATAEAQQKKHPGERVYTVTRAGPPGIQRYAQTWSGDNTTSWHMLRWNIRMGLTMSLSGMFNTGHDVGGFFGPVPDPELLVRWTQSGAFSPRFIMNSWKDGGETNSPWLHPRAMPMIRDAIRFRYRLLPYLYTLYREAAESGVPMLRPTFFEFEDDARAFADSDDFMLGPSLLVASVVGPGQRERRVYLPRGVAGWYDFWTSTWHPPGHEVVVAAPLGRIPLFVPAGGMVAMTDTNDFSRLHDEASRQLRLFPPRGTGSATYALYEDDGHSLGYRSGGFAVVEFEMRTTRRIIELNVRKSGGYAVPYRRIRIVLPAGERRRLVPAGDDVALISTG